MDRRTISFQYTPLSTSLSGGIKTCHSESYETRRSPVHRDRDSQFQTFPLPLYVRPTFLISNWLANLAAMMCGKVNTIVVKLVDSTARDIRPGTPKEMTIVSFNSERPRLSVDVYNTWAELFLTLNDSGATHFCVAPTARPGASYDLTLVALGKKRKKAARGVRFKSGLLSIHHVPYLMSHSSPRHCSKTLNCNLTPSRLSGAILKKSCKPCPQHV